jgi:hypothetical protein
VNSFYVDELAYAVSSCGHPFCIINIRVLFERQYSVRTEFVLIIIRTGLKIENLWPHLREWYMEEDI